LMRAKLLLRSTACIIKTNVPSASPRSGMLRNLYRVLVRSSAYTIYRHRARARVINYWCQGADVLTVPLPPDRTQCPGCRVCPVVGAAGARLGACSASHM
jgi:hypothetical protein